MEKYVVFLHGNFQNKENILNLIGEKFKGCEFLKQQKFIIEKEVNLIMVFSSDIEKPNLTQKFKDLLNNTIVQFYFLFDIRSVVGATAHPNLIDYIFNNVYDEYYKIDYLNNEQEINFLDVDSLLEKIGDKGYESLNEIEKNYLKNFEN